MASSQYDIIVIGAGSAGLSISLFMHKAGFKVLLIDRTDHHIGGDCLNDGCVPSKALIHVARLVHQAKEARQFGLSVEGSVDMRKAVAYVYGSQEIIRAHENAEYFRADGLEVALGDASFTGKNEVRVDGKVYNGKKIVIATGSRPAKLKIPGVELVKYYDNESIFQVDNLPKKLLVIGGGPIGIEIGQAFKRLGAEVTIIHRGGCILKNDHTKITQVLQECLQKEGIVILLNAQLIKFNSPTEAEVQINNSQRRIGFDAIFVATGRSSNTENLNLENAGIKMKDGAIIPDKYLRTTNKDVLVCGDVAGSLKFSHAAEHQARIILNNLFSPLKKKLNNDHLSWVTFSDPEIATFGLSEDQLKKRNVSYTILETGFEEDDRAVTDNYRYGKLILFISRGNFLAGQKILGGTMVAPGAGELIQELILANANGLSINKIFDKIYPYPVASRINQRAIVEHKSKGLTDGVKRLLKIAYTLFR